MSNGPKTRPTTASVADFIAAQPDATRRADCLALQRLMQDATGEPAILWGDAIIGFGAYGMDYANGKTLDWPLVAFSPRKGDISVYLMPGLDGYAERLQRLGKHKTGKVCLYIKRLADIELGVLDELIRASVAAMAPQRVTLELRA
jgi:hypothetical protein